MSYCLELVMDQNYSSQLQEYFRLHHGEQGKSVTEIFEELGQAPYFLKYDEGGKGESLILIYSTPESDVSQRIVSEANGIVLDLSDYSVVCMGLFNMVRITPEEMGHHIVANDMSKLIMHEAVDGPVIKIWYHKTKWMISSHRRLSARFGRFGHEVPYFGRILFKALERKVKAQLKDPTENENEKDPKDPTENEKEKDPLEHLLETHLDKNYTYTVVLEHSAIAQVIDRTFGGRATLVSMRNMTTLREVDYETLATQEPLFDLPKRVTNMDAHIIMASASPDYWRPVQLRGMVLTLERDHGYDRYWCDSREFSQALELRGNWPTIEQAYLASTEQGQRHDLRTLFPRRKTRFNAIDCEMARLGRRFKFIKSASTENIDGFRLLSKPEQEASDANVDTVDQLDVNIKKRMIGNSKWRNILHI